MRLRDLAFSTTKLSLLIALAIGYSAGIAQHKEAPSESQSEPQAEQSSNAYAATSPPTGNAPSTHRYPARTSSAPKVSKDTKGFRLGSFVLLPEISITGVYSDNVFAEHQNEKNDWFSIISPAALLRSDWRKHKLELSTGANIYSYDTYKSEDVTDHWIDGRGRYDISNRTNVYAGAGISKNHEDRSYPNRAYTNAKPTRFWDTSAHAGMFHRFENGNKLRLGVTRKRLNFDDPPSTVGGTVSMADRDRTHSAIGGRASFKNSVHFEPFLQGSTEARRYKTSFDDNGYQRDSDGYRAAVGFKFNIEPLCYGEAYVGALRQNYRDVSLPDITVPDFGATLTWVTSPNTRVKAVLQRYVEESTLLGVSASLDTVIGTRIEYRYRPDKTFNARFNYAYSDFKGTDISDPANPFNRKDHSYGVGVGFKYDVNKFLWLTLNYEYRRRDSNYQDYSAPDPMDHISGDYIDNRIMFSIGTH